MGTRRIRPGTRVNVFSYGCSATLPAFRPHKPPLIPKAALVLELELALFLFLCRHRITNPAACVPTRQLWILKERDIGFLYSWHAIFRVVFSLPPTPDGGEWHYKIVRKSFLLQL